MQLTRFFFFLNVSENITGFKLLGLISMKKSKNSQLFKTEIKSLISRLTTHGPARVVESTNLCHALLWTCLVLVSWTATFWLISQYTIDFLSFPYITNIGIFNELGAVEFPTVTVW